MDGKSPMPLKLSSMSSLQKMRLGVERRKEKKKKKKKGVSSSPRSIFPLNY